MVGTTEEELRKHPLAGTLSKIFELTYTRDLTNDLRALRNEFQFIDSNNGFNLITSVLEFILGIGIEADAIQVIDTMAEMVSPATGDKMMTLSDQLIQKGVEQGMQQGMQQGVQKGKQAGVREVAIRMLRQGMALAVVAQCTGLSIAKLKALKESLAQNMH